MSQEATFDIIQAIENGRWSNFQKLVLALVIPAIVMDGFNNQILGFAIPVLSQAWHLKPGVFASIVGVTLISMSIGTIVGGVAGDRYGRKALLILSILIF